MLSRLLQNPYETRQDSVLEQDLLQATERTKTDQASAPVLVYSSTVSMTAVNSGSIPPYTLSSAGKRL